MHFYKGATMLRKLLNLGVLSVLVLSPLALAVGCMSDNSDRPHSLTGDGSSDDSRPVTDDKGHVRPDLSR
jgi:hypothetical protein